MSYPPEFDYDFPDEVGTNPSYCTQPAFVVAWSQCDERGQSHQSHNDVGATLDACSSTQNANAYSVNNQEPSVVAGDVVQDDVEDHIGGSRVLHSYAKRVGFYIRTSTTCYCSYY